MMTRNPKNKAHPDTVKVSTRADMKQAVACVLLTENMRLDLLHENVGRDLKGHVGNEEQAQRNVVL